LEITVHLKSVINIAIVVMLSTLGSAYAQGNSQHNRQDNRQDNNDCRDGQGNCAGPNQRARPNQNARKPSQQPQRNFNTPQPRMYNDARGDERGAGPNHSYYRGGRLPSEYRTRQYVVDDWRGHRLSAPPRGYHWVQTGGDYVLVAIATGVILQLLLNN
jgi:Ni/Co efflux regulator RcnB